MGPAEDGRILRQVRAAAVIATEGKVLLFRCTDLPFWSLPGGRVDPGEPWAGALARELAEEIGAEIGVGSLRWVMENRFRFNAVTYDEICVVFDARAHDGPASRPCPEPFAGTEAHVPLEYRWFPVERLAGLELRPLVLARILAEPLPAQAVHLVVDDREATADDCGLPDPLDVPASWSQWAP